MLEVAPGSVLAEVADDDGRTLELLPVPVDAAKRLETEDVPSRPETSQDGPGLRHFSAARAVVGPLDRRRIAR